MEKIVSLAPLPALIFSELFKAYGIEAIEVVDASSFTPEQIIAAVKDAQYIIGDYTFQRPITRAVAMAARQVKLIQQPSVGYQHIDVQACTAAGIKVSVGSIPHPMEEKHYIEWIELIINGKVLRQFLKPGDAPSAMFDGVTATTLIAREYCNLHGLWKA